MGQHLITTPASAGNRQRDDYGAAAGITFTPSCYSFNSYKNSRNTRSFPVVQSRTVAAMGGLNNVG